MNVPLGIPELLKSIFMDRLVLTTNLRRWEPISGPDKLRCELMTSPRPPSWSTAEAGRKPHREHFWKHQLNSTEE